MGCKVHLARKCLQFTPTFWRAILTRKVGQTDLVFLCDEGSLVGLCGATENAGVENAIRSKLQGWKMQE